MAVFNFSIDLFTKIGIIYEVCGRGVARLTHLTVTEKIAGSNPVARAPYRNETPCPYGRSFFFNKLQLVCASHRYALHPRPQRSWI